MGAGTITDAVVRAARRAARQVAVSCGSETLCWAELEEAASAVAGTFAGLGVGAGDRVAVALPTCIEWVVSACATWQLGAVLVPVKAALADVERADVLADAEPALVVGDIGVVPWEGARLSREAVHHAAVAGPGRAGPTRGSKPGAGPGPGDLAVLAYTSGTTGLPRGVTWTHEAVLWAAAHRVEPALLEGRTLGHIVSLSIPGAIVALVNGVLGTARNALVVAAPDALVATLAAEGIEYLGSSAALLQRIAESEPAGVEGLRLQEVLYGGSHTQPWVVDRVQEMLGCELVRVYGMTETTTVGTRLAPELHRAGDPRRDRRLLSVGAPVEGFSMRIVDRGADASAGDVGEVLLAGPSVTRGYWRDPEADAAAFSDGWLRTGDLGRVDEEGLLQIVGRTKDMLKVSGFTVYAAEVERALAAHPAVAEAAVVGLPDAATGEAIAAALRLRPGSVAPDPKALAEHLAPRIAAYKAPTRVQVVDELPRNAAGKVDKSALRDLMGG